MPSKTNPVHYYVGHRARAIRLLLGLPLNRGVEATQIREQQNGLQAFEANVPSLLAGEVNLASGSLSEDCNAMQDSADYHVVALPLNDSHVGDEELIYEVKDLLADCPTDSKPN